MSIYLIAVSVPISLHLHAFFVSILNEINFSDWREQVQFYLGVLDIDLALQIKISIVITAISIVDEKAMSIAWNRSNRLSIMFMRMTIASNINTTLSTTNNTMEFFNNVEKHFHTTDKSLVGTLMANLTTMKFDSTRRMHEHILKMTNLATKLKVLGMNIDEFFLVQFILNSLPSKYGPFQIHYNIIKNILLNLIIKVLVYLRISLLLVLVFYIKVYTN